mmetsp:Transcript_47578/g.110950  ORF Transcript_47578/g.110950 Transcript_47578/m.110950 type:complete len:490 (+) Transcript_47578:92-1561(+)
MPHCTRSSCENQLLLSISAALLLCVCGLDNPGVPDGTTYDYSKRISGDSEGYPDGNDYVTQRLMPLTTVGVVLSFCFFLYFVLWLLVRMTHGCCGAGCCKTACCVACCGNTHKEETGGAGFGCRTFLVILLIVGAVLAVPGCAVGYSGTVQVRSGALDLAEWMDLRVQDLVDMASLTASVSRDLATPGADSKAGELEAEARDVQKQIGKVTDAVESGDADRVAYVQYIFYGAFMVVPLLGVLAYLTGSRCMANSMTGLVFAGLVITWLIFGLLFLTAVVVDDTCYEVAKFVNFEANNIPDDWCVKPQEALDRYTEIHAEAVAAWERLPPGALPGVSSVLAWEPPEPPLRDPNQAFANFVKNREYRHEVRVSLGIDDQYDYSRTAVPNSAGCFDLSQLERNFARVECQVAYLASAADGLLAASYVGSCWYMTEMASELLNTHCEDTLDGFISLFVAHGIIGMAYIMLLAAGLRGSAYWTSKREPKIAPEQ